MYIHIYIWIYLQPTYSYHFGDLPTANAQTREVKGDLQPLYDYVLVKSKDCGGEPSDGESPSWSREVRVWWCDLPTKNGDGYDLWWFNGINGI